MHRPPVRMPQSESRRVEAGAWFCKAYEGKGDFALGVTLLPETQDILSTWQ